MRASNGLLAGLLILAACGSARSDAGSGLSFPGGPGRAATVLGAEPLAEPGSGLRLGSAGVLGDYYFGRHALREGEAGGFRATTGLLLGPNASPGGSAGWQGPGAFDAERHGLGLATPARGADLTGIGAVPYLGVGYSGSSLKSGWGFSADLGLMSLNPGGAARFGRTLGSGPSLDEVLRDLRMAPIVQFGAIYAF